MRRGRERVQIRDQEPSPALAASPVNPSRIQEGGANITGGQTSAANSSGVTNLRLRSDDTRSSPLGSHKEESEMSSGAPKLGRHEPMAPHLTKEQVRKLALNPGTSQIRKNDSAKAVNHSPFFGPGMVGRDLRWISLKWE